MNQDNITKLLKYVDLAPGMCPILFGAISQVVIDHFLKIERDNAFRHLNEAIETARNQR